MDAQLQSALDDVLDEIRLMDAKNASAVACSRLMGGSPDTPLGSYALQPMAVDIQCGPGPYNVHCVDPSMALERTTELLDPRTYVPAAFVAS